MAVYCIENFKIEFDKTCKNKKYLDLEKLLIDYFFDKPLEDICTGTNLNGSVVAPFLKKRIPNAGGYRIYFYVIFKNGHIYLTYLHPKTGPYGIENIGKEHKASIQKDVIRCVKDNDLYLLSVCPDKDVLIFKKPE